MIGYDLFIFDFDGTLADSRLNIANSVNHALRLSGLEQITPASIYPLIGKVKLCDTFKQFFPALSSEQIDQLVQDFRTYQRENALHELTLFPDVLPTLHQLKTRQKHLAILTSKNIDQIEHILDKINLRQFFDVVYGDDLLEYKKPHKACVEYIWRSLPVDPRRSVMIGDSEVDIQTAQNAGIDMIAVGYGVDSPAHLLANGAKQVIRSLSELL